MAPPRVLLAPAAGAGIGGGHVMRDLALAAALHARGVHCSVAVPAWGARLVARFAEAPVEVVQLARSGDTAAIARALDETAAELLVVDDFSLDAAALAPLRRRGLPIAVIDDLADRAYACDLLVDPGHARLAADYAGLTPPGCELLVGPAYALVRASFARAARARRSQADRPVARVFVSFGLSDVDGVAGRAVAALRPRAPHARFDIALASDALSLPRLQRMAAADAGVQLHVDARDIAALMRAADVGVGAGGSATWERCALGLPSLAVVVADNQRGGLARLAAAGATLCLEMGGPDFEGRLGAAFERLCAPDLRRDLAAASRAVCDGQGAERVAEALLKLASTPGSAS